MKLFTKINIECMEQLGYMLKTERRKNKSRG